MSRRFSYGAWLFVFALLVAMPLAANFQTFVAQLRDNPLATIFFFAAAALTAFVGERVFSMR